MPNQTNDEQENTPPPELPPKPSNYPKINITTTNQHSNSYKTLIRFLFSLSNLIFFGGSLAGLVVLFYQKYILPNLKIRTERLTSLRWSVCKSYDRLLEALKTLARSHPQLYLTSPSASRAILPRNPSVEAADGEQAAGGRSGDSSDGDALAAEHAVPVDPTATAPIADERGAQKADQKEVAKRAEFNRPIIHRLAQIALALRTRSEPHGPLTRAADGEEPSEPTDQPGSNGGLRGMEALMTSLQTMREALMADAQQHTRVQQKLLASSHPHRAFALNQYNLLSNNNPLPHMHSPAPFDVDKDPYFIALLDLKNSIRNCKGLLLNRSKFY